MAVDLEKNTGADTRSEELESFLRDIISSDDDIRKTLQSEAIQEDELIEEAKGALDEVAFNFESKLQELKSAEQARDTVVDAGDNFWIAFGVFFWLASLGLIVLLAVGIGKWTGHILRWPLWPFVVGAIALLTVAIILAVIADRLETRAVETSQSSILPVESLRQSLDDQLRSLVVIPAIERAISFKFVAPSADVVNITDAPSLSSLVGLAGRIQTGSYRDAFVHLKRHGGAAIGLAGSRGVGKSELLRAFCEDPTYGKSTEKGGIIGIIIPAPVAYQAEPFLRLLIRRVAEAVPDYGKHVEGRTRVLPSVALNALVGLFAIACITVGFLLIVGFPTVSRHAIGKSVIVVGTLALAWLWLK